MKMELPSPVLHSLFALNKAGYEAYVVGGCVRDALMGKEPFDWDITTSALPEQTVAVFQDYRTIETGIRHGTVTVMVEETPLEITTYRVDGQYSDGRHPDTVAFTRSLTEDLRRRDFTINAMAYHPTVGLIDPFDGQTDLQAKMIRCVGDPETRFTEDALRILRCLRFSSVLDFTIDSDTANALRRLSPSLSRVSIERIAAEFVKILSGTNVVNTFEKYRDVLAVFLPELRNCTDFSLLSDVRPIPRTRLATLFYEADISAEEAQRVLRRLRLDKQTIREVFLLLSVRIKALYAEEAYLLRLLNQLGPELIFDYLELKRMDKATIQHAQRLVDEKVCYQVSMLAVDGADLIACGVTPGPKVGIILNTLLETVMDGACTNTKEELLNYVKEKSLC